MFDPAPPNHSDLFIESPIAVLCEDWSSIRTRVLEDGASDRAAFAGSLDDDPGYVQRLRTSHRFVDANPAALRLLGVQDLEELRERSPVLLPADPKGSVIRAILTGERFCEGERDFVNALGVRVQILWRTNLPATAEDFRRVYFFAVDISGQKQAQEALDAARDKLNHAGRLSLVGELVASMTHEVAQPISSIGMLAASAVRWLKHQPPRILEAEGVISRIVSSAGHAAQVLGRTRDFSRSARTTCVETAPVQVVTEALALVEYEARRHRVTLSVEADPDLPSIMADPIQIKQVIVNVVVNAFQAIASDPDADPRRAVTVEALRDDGGVLFRIRDTGPGITDKEKALEPFFSTKKEGLGLGLAICKRIVAHHGGILAIVTHDDGTEVNFTVPLAKAPDRNGSADISGKA